LEYELLRVGIPSRYSEYLLMVKVLSKKSVRKPPRIGIDKFEVELKKWD